MHTDTHATLCIATVILSRWSLRHGEHGSDNQAVCTEKTLWHIILVHTPVPRVRQSRRGRRLLARNSQTGQESRNQLHAVPVEWDAPPWPSPQVHMHTSSQTVLCSPYNQLRANKPTVELMTGICVHLQLYSRDRNSFVFMSLRGTAQTSSVFQYTSINFVWLYAYIRDNTYH